MYNFGSITKFNNVTVQRALTSQTNDRRICDEIGELKFTI